MAVQQVRDILFYAAGAIVILGVLAGVARVLTRRGHADTDTRLENLTALLLGLGAVVFIVALPLKTG